MPSNSVVKVEPGTCIAARRRAASRGALLLAVALLLNALACKPAQAPKAKEQPAAAGEQVRATVVTLQTVLEPSKRTISQTIVIANGRARSTDEVDRWRLFDVKNQKVTFVDDVEKTYRTVPFAQLAADRKAALTEEVPAGLPAAQLLRGNATRQLQGVNATELVVRMGAYERHLWIGEHSAIPAQLFAMMQASEPVATPLAATMRSAEEALMAVRGFPLADRAELPYGNGKRLVVDRTVTAIAQQDVPAAMLNVARSYRELPPTAAKPRRAPGTPRPIVPPLMAPGPATQQPPAEIIAAPIAPPPAAAPATATAAPATPPVAKKAAAAKPVAKKTTPKKATVKKAPAKKPTVNKAPAKTPAKTSATKKTPPKKTSPKKTPRKRG